MSARAGWRRVLPAAGGGLLMLVVAVTAWVSCVGTAAAAGATPVPTGVYLVHSELGNGLVLDDEHPTQAGSQATVAPLESYHYAQQWVLEQHDRGYYTMYNRENLWLFLGVDSTDLLAPIVEMSCQFDCSDAPAEKLKWKLEPQTDGTYLIRHGISGLVMTAPYPPESVPTDAPVFQFTDYGRPGQRWRLEQISLGAPERP